MILRDQIILLGQYELTSDMNSINLVAGRETPDKTTLGTDTRKYAADGLKTIAAGGSGFYDASKDASIQSLIAVHDTLISFLSQSGVGSPGYGFKSLMANYTPLQGSVGDEHAFTLDAVGRGDLIRGKVAHKGNVTATGQSTAFELGAASADQTLYALIHCYSISGTSPTLDVDVRSDTTSGMSSPIVKLSATQITAVGTQFLTLAGANTDTFYDLDFTVGGTDSPTFGLAVLLAIQ